MNKKVMIGGVIISLLFILGSYLAITKTAKPNIEAKTYTVKDASRPRIEVSSTLFDMGNIKVNDATSAKFTVKNVGEEPLQLLDISSSCGCTVGKVIYKGQESEEFGMHSAGDFQTPIEPGTEAVIEVIYRPYVMPVYGPVGREVYMSTNDPDNSKLVFQIKANVQ